MVRLGVRTLGAREGGFGGYPAAETSVPVAFPTASRPQAWAAGAPLLLLTTLLDLQPRVVLRRRSRAAAST